MKGITIEISLAFIILSAFLYLIKIRSYATKALVIGLVALFSPFLILLIEVIFELFLHSANNSLYCRHTALCSDILLWRVDHSCLCRFNI